MYYLISIVAFGLSLIPTSLCHIVARLIGTLIYYFIPVRRKVTFENIDRVYGETLTSTEKRKIALESYQTLAIVGIETLRLHYTSQEKLLSLVSVHGSEHLDNALAQEKGVIVFAGHFGNIVACGCAEAVRGVPVNVIAKGMHNKAAERFYFETLQKFGVKRIPTRRSKEQITQALNQGETVYMVVDQHMPAHRGLICDFFGQLASTTPAPTRFARETGAQIIPCQTAIRQEPGKHQINYREEFLLDLDGEEDEILRTNTERINRIIEADLQRYPGQWLWQHKRWKAHDKPDDWNIPKDLLKLLE